MNPRISIPLIFAFALLFKPGASAQTTSLTFNNPAQNGGTNSFTVPAGVTSITVQCWGGGGGGGNSNNGTSNGGGGGGGGAFTQKVFTGLTAGTVFNINVGAGGTGAPASSTTLATDGGDSWFSSSTTVMAKGGTHGLNNSNSGGAGGLGIGTSIGDVGFIFSGGSAGNGSNSGGSAGGSSAGKSANGTTGANAATNGNITAVTTAPSGGGNGGRGNSGSATNGGNGEAGSAPGGGGGGSDDVASKFGGSGANGQVVVTYTLPNVSGLSASAAPACIGNSTTITVSSSNLSTGTYTVTYTVSGTNTISSTTATMSFTSGAPGSGTFTTSSLSTAGGANVVNITKLTDQSTNNSSSLSVSTATFATYNSVPSSPGSITGTSAQCSSTSALTYNISAVPNATTYIWSVPTGWSITGGQGTTSITVTSGATGQNGNITVTAGNSCGSSSASSLAVTSSFCSKTYYSLGGNWNSNASWSTVSHASSTNTGTYPVAGDIAFIGGSNTITVQSGTSMAASSVTVSDDASTCGLTINSAATLSVSGDFTVNTSGALSSSGNGTVVFNGSSTQTVSGSGTFNFGNITMSTSSAANVEINNSISVSGTISWTTDGLLVVGSNANVTLGTQTSPISSPTATRYIQLDGSSGSNSNLIRTTSNSITQWQFTFPVGTATGGYTPLTIPTISAGNLPTNNSTLSVKPIVTSDLTGRLKRTFRLTVAGNANATTFSNGAFSYSDVTDISSGDSETDYTTGWLMISGGTWSSDAGSVNTAANTFTITGGTSATASLTTGTYYYTCGSTVNAQHTWYSYQTGSYSDFNTWTLDPSGTTFDNALNIYPAIGDEIHILNGFTVTVDISSQILSATTIDGGATLDLSTSTNHNLGVITGTGLLREKGSVLPTGTYTDFVSTSGGTIEYYDAGGNLSTTQTTYNKLLMTNSTGTNITYVLVSDMTVNGTMNLSATGSGTVTWQINDASNSQRTITLNSDLTIGSGGAITAGTGNSTSTAQHSITFYGNFTNNGIVQFFDPTDASFSSANYTSGAVYTTALKGNAINATFSSPTKR